MAASRENFGTIPIIREEENAEKTQPQMEEEKWKGKMSQKIESQF